MWLEHFTYNNFFSQSRGEKTSPEQKCEYCGTEKDLIPDNSLTNHTICWNCYDKTIVEQIIAGNKEKGKKSVRIFFCRNCEKTIDTDKSYAEIRPDWKCNCAEPILVRGIRSY
jgi:hypothetical protein